MLTGPLGSARAGKCLHSQSRLLPTRILAELAVLGNFTSDPSWHVSVLYSLMGRGRNFEELGFGYLWRQKFHLEGASGKASPPPLQMYIKSWEVSSTKTGRGQASHEFSETVLAGRSACHYHTAPDRRTHMTHASQASVMRPWVSPEALSFLIDAWALASAPWSTQ